MVLSFIQVTPQKYLVWKENRSAWVCTGAAEGWEGGYRFLTGRSRSLNARGLWPHRRSSTDSRAFPEACGCCRRQCLVTQAWLVHWDSPEPCLRVILWLGLWPFECHLGCHAESWGTSTRVWPQPALPTWESPAVSAESNPTAIYFTWMSPFSPEVPVIQGWVNSNQSQRYCWNSPFPGPRDPALTLPG